MIFVWGKFRPNRPSTVNPMGTFTWRSYGSGGAGPVTVCLYVPTYQPRRR